MSQQREIALVVADSHGDAARARLTAPPAGIDWLEFRIDALAPEWRTPDVVAELVARAARPVIATCRTAAERGGGPEADADREALLTAALGAGARLVDLEWNWLERDPSLATRIPAEKTLLSHHEWESPPQDLESRFERLLTRPAAAFKFVAHVETFADAQRILGLARDVGRRRVRAAVFGLGPVGRVTRILGALGGSWLTYLAPEDGPVVPGDLLTLREAFDIYGLTRVPEGVKLLGLVGNPVRHSLSPELHNAVIRRLGERYLYVPFAAPDLRPVLDLVRRGEVRGLSVTIPHKETVLPLLDRVDPEAGRVGAVNTVLRQGTELVGYNTDLIAARQIVAGFENHEAPAAVLGAGGAARAVILALHEQGRRVWIVNRDEARGRRTAEALGASWAGPVPAALDGRGVRVLVNATPLGGNGDAISGLPRFDAAWSVLDLAYRRGGTPLELDARRSGATAVDGIEFLVRQAAAQFALWTGRQVPAELYRQVLTANDAVPGRGSEDA